MGQIKPLDTTKRDDRERRIRQAMILASELTENGKRKVSIREAASAFNIPKSTLSDRLAGGKPHHKAHTSQQKLSVVDEKAVLRWIRRVELQGFPPKIEHVRQAAKKIAGTHIGT